MAIDIRDATVIAQFAIELGRSRSGNMRVAGISGQSFRKEVIDAASRVLCHRATIGPIVIAVEDVHWADSMTLELLSSLSAQVQKLPILLIQTSRSAVARAAPETASEKLNLSGLDAVAMSDLVASIWGQVPPPGLTSFVVERCDGIPLYAEELTVFIQSRQTLGQSSSDWAKLLSESGVSTSERPPFGAARRCRACPSNCSVRQCDRQGVQRHLAPQPSR